MSIFRKLFGVFFSETIKKQNENINETENIGTYYFINPDLTETSMAKKTVITRVLEVETNDAIVEFPQNRTLLAEQLTNDSPTRAEIVKGLRTLEDVFTHFKPDVKLEFEDPGGQTKKETLAFNELKDFEMEGLMKNSDFLKDMGKQKERFMQIDKQFRTNKVLRDAVSDEDSRKALINALQALLKELQDTNV